MPEGRFKQRVDAARTQRQSAVVPAAPKRQFSSQSFDDLVIERSWLTASAAVSRLRLVAGAGASPAVPETAEDVTGDRQGGRFEIPLVIPEGLTSGDGRSFEPGALSRRELPLPLLWQIHTSDGHDGSVVVGRIDSMERTEDGMGNAVGYFDTGEYGKEAERLVRNKMMRFVSADLDNFEARQISPELSEEDGPDEEGRIRPQLMKITKGRVMGVTLVAKPAFQECVINLVDEANRDGDDVLADGVYESTDPEAKRVITAAASVAAKIPVNPPQSWFSDPQLSYPSAISVTDDGRVFGHIASWDMDHIGMPFGTRVPQSRSKYAYFHTGLLRTEEGKDVSVGQLTLSGGHAPLQADAAAAVKHYDDTNSAIADVRAGEDAFGVWVAGALRPGASPEQIRSLRASSPSGDWRQIRGSLELVAVCQVNVPGFPVTRALAASGQVMCLVAAGAKQLMQATATDSTATEARLAALEAAELSRQSQRAAELSAKMRPIIDSHKSAQVAELTARRNATLDRVFAVEDYLTTFKSFSPEKRDELAKKGHAMKDGSFPIENKNDLKRAVQAAGRAGDGKAAAVRRHIVKRARGLGETDAIPQHWTENSMDTLVLTMMDIREK